MDKELKNNTILGMVYNQRKTRPTMPVDDGRVESLSAPVPEEYIEPKRSPLHYYKRIPAERYTLAKELFGQRDFLTGRDTTPKKNFLLDAIEKIKSAGRSIIPSALGIAYVGGPDDFPWKHYAKAVTEGNKEEKFLSELSTPEYHPKLEERFELLYRYPWTKNVADTVEKHKVHDISPQVLSENYMRFKHPASFYGIGGAYKADTDSIEFSDNWWVDKTETLAHEFLHKFFREDRTPARVNHTEFNKDWDKILIETKDEGVRRRMIAIDQALLNSYGMDPYDPGFDFGVANERFAWLGSEIFSKGMSTKGYEPLLRYYNAIFNTK